MKARWLDEVSRRLALRYGSVEGYLSDALGLTEADLARLRQQHLEKAAT
ncbi:MAG: tyrosine-protein phosphatase [Acidimicrobiia bacterium]|nr:tyrosine-protein phosphatase [Acidimicrobiia bacterium]